MTVGSVCSRIFCLRRLANTAATRVRSSGLPVSFSTMEARMTSCSGVRSGRSRARRSQTSFTNCLLSLLHPLDRQLAGIAAPEIVAVRQQAAFARHVLDGAGQDRAVEQARHDLLGRQALRNGDEVLHDLAFDQGLDHVAHACALGKQIFAGLELGPRLEREHAADEDELVLVDDAFALQEIGDLDHPGARGNVDDLVRLSADQAPRSAICRRQPRRRRQSPAGSAA